MSGPFEFPPDPFDDELDRLLSPIPEPGPQPKANGKEPPRPPKGMEFGQSNVEEFCAAIQSYLDFVLACGTARAMREDGLNFDGDITVALIEAGRRIGIKEPEVLDIVSGHRDEEEESRAEPLETVCASSYAGKHAEAVRFLDARKMFPRGMVTLLTGAGGTGKTLLTLQLLLGTALRTIWLGRPVNEDGNGVALFYSAEEPEQIVQKRLEDIAASEGVDIAEATGLHVHYAMDEFRELFKQGKDSPVVPTANLHRLKATVKTLRPDLLVIDNRGQVCLANENDRIVAHKVMSYLGNLARSFDLALVLLAHPSLTGINSGSGLSGSTGWPSAARAHVHMGKPGDGDDKPGAEDDGKRVLTVMKANHGRIGEQVNMQWELGCYRCTDEPQRAGSDIGKADKAERVFLSLLKIHNARGDYVSSRPSANNFAPKIFAGHPRAEGVTVKMFRRAMETLLENGAIEAIQYGPPSKLAWRLEVVKCNL